MIGDLCLICTKKELSIKEKLSDLSLLKDICDGFAVIPTLNLKMLNSNFCDILLVLHKGKVRESGSHQELLWQEGTYKKLYELQRYA